MESEKNRVRNLSHTTLSDDWYLLRKYTVEYQRRDGTWQHLIREVYDKGDGVCLLLYNRQQQTVVLTRQFRLPTFVKGDSGFLIEVAAGLLEGEDPTTRIRMEAEEETGYQVKNVEKIFDAWMSPGAITEKLHFFVGEYQPKDKVSNGGGLVEEGEDIDVLELPFKQALAAIKTGEICDAKTIMLLHYAALYHLLEMA